MNCPHCGYDGGDRKVSHVHQTTKRGNWIERRRRCYQCKRNFKTIEILRTTFNTMAGVPNG